MSFSLDVIFCFVYTLSGVFKYHITVANISAHDKTQCMVKGVVLRWLDPVFQKQQLLSLNTKCKCYWGNNETFDKRSFFL